MRGVTPRELLTLDALRDGPSTCPAIARTSGVSTRRIRQVLATLEACGYAVRDGQYIPVWTITDAGRSAVLTPRPAPPRRYGPRWMWRGAPSHALAVLEALARRAPGSRPPLTCIIARQAGRRPANVQQRMAHLVERGDVIRVSGNSGSGYRYAITDQGRAIVAEYWPEERG